MHSNRFRPLLDRWCGPAATEPAFLRDGLRVYAIGDIHGYSGLLDILARSIENDLGRRRPDEVLTVFLGDYVDRGPDSAGVIQRLIEARFPTPLVTLRGNHEDLMMRALAHPAAMEHWLYSGGLETVASYGVRVPKSLRGNDLGRLHKEFLDAFPQAHRTFLAETRLCLEIGGYFFVHAGARPGVQLERQAEADLLWIREEFSGSDYDFGKVIVHGHTPHRKPESEPRRINVDTGAFKTGVLTCVVLEGRERRFLSTRPNRL